MGAYKFRLDDGSFVDNVSLVECDDSGQQLADLGVVTTSHVLKHILSDGHFKWSTQHAAKGLYVGSEMIGMMTRTEFFASNGNRMSLRQIQEIARESMRIWGRRDGQ